MALQTMNPIGGITATGSEGNANAYNNGRGFGWQKTIQTTNTLGIAGGLSDTILIPQKALNCSVTIAYNGAGTVTADLVTTNASVDEIAAGTAVFGKLPTTVSPQIVGGTANSTAITVLMPTAPTGLRLLVGGSGSAGGDTFTIHVSASSRLTV